MAVRMLVRVRRRPDAARGRTEDVLDALHALTVGLFDELLEQAKRRRTRRGVDGANILKDAVEQGALNSWAGRLREGVMRDKIRPWADHQGIQRLRGVSSSVIPQETAHVEDLIGLRADEAHRPPAPHAQREAGMPSRVDVGEPPHFLDLSQVDDLVELALCLEDEFLRLSLTLIVSGFLRSEEWSACRGDQQCLGPNHQTDGSVALEAVREHDLTDDSTALLIESPCIRRE